MSQHISYITLSTTGEQRLHKILTPAGAIILGEREREKDDHLAHNTAQYYMYGISIIKWVEHAPFYHKTINNVRMRRGKRSSNCADIAGKSRENAEYLENPSSTARKVRLLTGALLWCSLLLLFSLYVLTLLACCCCCCCLSAK